MKVENTKPLHQQLWDLALALAEETSISGTYAQELARLGTEIEHEYVKLDSTGDVPTVAQGVALARFLRPEFHRKGIAPIAHVSRGAAGLPTDYLYVYFPASGYEGGIDREGKVST